MNEFRVTAGIVGIVPTPKKGYNARFISLYLQTCPQTNKSVCVYYSFRVTTKQPSCGYLYTYVMQCILLL